MFGKTKYAACVQRL
uniref:Uncharacterized protein n=1 Tax=Anguilla anguilla TaxID=7936 RepID=A0A0E9RW10_ANGAN